MNEILKGLLTLLAPLVPFTAEEAWQMSGRTGSVHSQVFEDLGIGIPDDQFFLHKWEGLLSLRSRVNEKLEEARREKKIGKSLEALVEISGKDLGNTKNWTSHRETLHLDLEELFIVSKVVLKPTDGEETITVTRAEEHGMKKCIRCWKYWDHVGSDAAHPELCDRCTKVVLNFGPS